MYKVSRCIILPFTAVTNYEYILLFSKYDKEKETALEEYLDNAINTMGVRLRKLNAQTIKVADFTFKAVHGLVRLGIHWLRCFSLCM